MLRSCTRMSRGPYKMAAVVEERATGDMREEEEEDGRLSF